MGNPSDPPPSYEQATGASSSTPSALDDLHYPSITYHSFSWDTRTSHVATLSPSLSEDASALHSLITRQAQVPPRLCLTVRGAHTETRSRPNRKENDTETIIDFEFQIDLTPYFVAPPDQQDQWHELRVVSDDDGIKTYRGGRCRSRSPRHGADKRSHFSAIDQDEETALVGNDRSGPGLMGWCERFCEERGVKSFTYTRRVVGLDVSILRSILTSHIRSLNYQGNIRISANLTNKSIVVYSPHWINRLRNHGFLYYFCILAQLWILTWPVIWWLERRYTVVESDWFVSRPTGAGRTYAGGRDEAAVAHDLAPVVTQAAWERRTDGRVLTDSEIRLLRQLEREGRQRGGRVVMVDWDQISGWGADQSV
ncbi:hypothetical protein ATEIFO6365_0010018300 [Aspergillus terreus]|uniref:Uncharacterized protein n=1 Tax=Aspergillus terreus TaxID=33178 RepID=A0A5M3Z990_ASPTE|nr:hypothetical protein ATETN484_0012016200 [Aspergillus terreus]GFF19410.1 hypothetical protein ATEIFO6365_0010018300 [Aspergillus terreus]